MWAGTRPAPDQTQRSKIKMTSQKEKFSARL
jgi:hypothetical protein